ncbi:MAG: major capsid protein P2 [Pseudomonadota bacterium]
MSVGKLIRKGLPFSNVVASGVATANVTPGRTLELVRLKLGGTSLTKAMISQIKVKANGKVILESNGSRLDKINAYRGITTEAAYLDIPFYDNRMDTEFDKAVGAFDTSNGIGNITHEITIAGATAPTLEQILTESAAQKRADGAAAPYARYLSKILQYPFSVATGGKLAVNIPFGPANGAIIKRVHVEHTGNMTGATVKQDGLVIHESLKAENENEQKRHGRVPQANMYTIDFCPEGNILNALDTRSAKSLEWLFDFSAADNGNVIVEYLDVLENN